MSKSSREGLFGITLTELVIILFFIMLLLAIFNIEEANEELEETQKLIPESSVDIIPKSVIVDVLFPDGEITSDLVPIKDIEDKIRELQKAQDDFKKLTEESSEGDGDCREDGFWITSKCADYCWEIDSSKSNRKYEYLVDIGVCKSSVVVQKSNWLQKSDSDFILVDGALEMTTQNVMKATELYEYLDIVKEPGYVKEPKQCFHYVRLVDLGAGSIPRWETIDKEVANRVGRLPLTSADRGYEEIRNRFPADICDVILESDQITPIKDTRAEKETLLNIVNAKLDSNSFVNAFTKECSNSRPTRNKDIILTYQISLSNSGDVINIESLSIDSLVNANLKRLDSMAKRALKKSNFSPEYLEGIAVPSNLIQKIPFGQNACS
tara:strand:+ start:5360 stop:6502 length:1143 start_codon:yes stop_codon:yes gene_type:complete